MTTQEFKTYRNISAVTQFRIKDTERRIWTLPDFRDSKERGELGKGQGHGERVVGWQNTSWGDDIRKWGL